MYKREDIIDILLELNLPMEEYWLQSEAALVLHGVRYEVANIEVGCSDDYFDSLVAKGNEVSQEFKNKPSIGMSEDLRIYRNWNPTQIDYIESIPVASLESIKKDKKDSKSKEDKHDIELIDKLLSLLETV